MWSNVQIVDLSTSLLQRDLKQCHALLEQFVTSSLSQSRGNDCQFFLMIMVLGISLKLDGVQIALTAVMWFSYWFHC